MKLKYFKPLLLILAIVTLSSCWWDDDDRTVDIPTLVYYHWRTDFDGSNPNQYSEFIFFDNGIGEEAIYTEGHRKPEVLGFSWATGTRRGNAFIELRYGREPNRIEYFYDVRFYKNREYTDMEADHYLNKRDFDNLIPTLRVIFEGF